MPDPIPLPPGFMGLLELAMGLPNTYFNDSRIKPLAVNDIHTIPEIFKWKHFIHYFMLLLVCLT